MCLRGGEKGVKQILVNRIKRTESIHTHVQVYIHTYISTDTDRDRKDLRALKRQYK